MALKGDPGKLDPQSSASSQLFTVNQLGYDNLVAVDAKSGEIQSQLATEWKVDGTTVTLTLADGVTCSDGSDFTATTVADNIAYVERPEEQEPLPRHVPAGGCDREGRRRRRHRDDHAGRSPRRSCSTASPACRWSATSGMEDRTSLADRTDGTGPYELTEAVPGDHYTYEIRDGYTWGPNGATTAEKGMPDTVVMKVVENEGTAANLLVSGEINAATVHRARTSSASTAQDLFATEHARPGGRAVVQPQRRPRDQRRRRADGAHPGARPRRARLGGDRRSGYAGHHPRGDRAGLLPG